MRTCSFRLQIASAAAMAVALTVCSVARAEFRAEADRLALEIDLVTGETLQAHGGTHVWLPARGGRGGAPGDWPRVRERHAAIYSRRGRRRGCQHRI